MNKVDNETIIKAVCDITSNDSVINIDINDVSEVIKS